MEAYALVTNGRTGYNFALKLVALVKLMASGNS